MQGGVSECREGAGRSNSVFSDLKSDFPKAISKLVAETWVAVSFCHPMLPLQVPGWESWGERVTNTGLTGPKSSKEGR